MLDTSLFCNALLDFVAILDMRRLTEINTKHTYFLLSDSVMHSNTNPSVGNTLCIMILLAIVSNITVLRFMQCFVDIIGGPAGQNDINVI